MGNFLKIEKDVLTVNLNDPKHLNTRTIHFRRRFNCQKKTLHKILHIKGNIISYGAFGNVIIDRVINEFNEIHYRITPDLINGVLVVVYSSF